MTATFKPVSASQLSQVFTQRESTLFTRHIGQPVKVMNRCQLQRSRNARLEPFVTVVLESYQMDVPEAFCSLAE